MKKGYIKLIATVIGVIILVCIGAYIALTSYSNTATTILNPPTIQDKINSLRPYIDAADAYNTKNVDYTNQLQPVLENLRKGTHTGPIPLPNYKAFREDLALAKQSYSTPYEDINKSSDDVLALLDQLIPLSEQLEEAYANEGVANGSSMNTEELTNKYILVAEQFNATYNAFDMTLDTHNNTLYTEWMEELANENRYNAVNFIKLNFLLAQIIDRIDPDSNTDVRKVDTALQDAAKGLNQLKPGVTPATQASMKAYQEAVNEFLADAHAYVTVNSTFSEAYPLLYVKYNRLVNRANTININDLDAAPKK